MVLLKTSMSKWFVLLINIVQYFTLKLDGDAAAGILKCLWLWAAVTSQSLIFVGHLKNFPNIIFFLITWELHAMHPNRTHFPFFPGPPFHSCAFTKEKRKKKKKKLSPGWMAYVLTGAWPNSWWPAPKGNWALPTSHQTPYILTSTSTKSQIFLFWDWSKSTVQAGFNGAEANFEHWLNLPAPPRCCGYKH